MGKGWGTNCLSNFQPQWPKIHNCKPCIFDVVATQSEGAFVFSSLAHHMWAKVAVDVPRAKHNTFCWAQSVFVAVISLFVSAFGFPGLPFLLTHFWLNSPLWFCHALSGGPDRHEVHAAARGLWP